MGAGRVILTFLSLWLFWTALTGSLHPQEILVGGAASLAVAAFSHRVLFQRGVRTRAGGAVSAIPYFFAYLWAELKAHLKVIALILHPRMPIKPGIVKVPTRLESDIGITGLADAITMTPGTLSVDIDEGEKALYVHWIDVKTTAPEETRARIAWPFERFLRRIFG